MLSKIHLRNFLIVSLVVVMQYFILSRYAGNSLCSLGNTQLSLSLLFLPWLYIEKYPPADYSHICILLTMKHFQVAIVKHCLGTPLSIQWPVTRTGIWVSTLPLFSCHWYAHIQITRPVLHSQGPTSISYFPMASFNDFITHRQDSFFFSNIRTALASTMPRIGLTCLGRLWIMQRDLGVLEIQSSMIIPFTRAGCRLSWLD